MNTRIASLALALVIAAPASAFAQGFDAPRVDRTETRSFFGMPAWVDAAREGDAVTTGSIGPRRGYESRSGSAARQDRGVLQFGNSADDLAE